MWGAVVAPLLAAQPAPALLPGEGALPRAKCVAWGGTVAEMLVQCFGGGLGRAQNPNTHCSGVGRNLIPGCGDSISCSLHGKIRSGKAPCEGKEKQC